MEILATPVSKKPNKAFSILEILQLTVLIGFILYFGKALFIPLSFAMLISFILYPVCKWMEKKGINKNVAVFISIFVITILLVAIIYLLVAQMVDFSNEWQSFSVKLLETQNQLSFFITERFGISSEKQLELFHKYMGSFNSKIFPFMQSILYSSSQSIFSLILIIVFSTLILLHRHTLSKVVNRIFPPEKGKPSNEILIETIHAYYNFIKGMLLVYLIVGILNSIGLAYYWYITSYFLWLYCSHSHIHSLCWNYDCITFAYDCFMDRI
jgi:predicted PurR-regulated permease PerM